MIFSVTPESDGSFSPKWKQRRHFFGDGAVDFSEFYFLYRMRMELRTHSIATPESAITASHMEA